MILKVRTHPTTIYYVTGNDAWEAREAADVASEKPAFVTESFGGDGWVWDTPEEFEADWAEGPGCEDASFAKHRSQS